MARAPQAAAPASPARSSECVGGPPALQNELRELVTRAVRDGDAGLLVHVDFPCVSVRAEPAQVVALVVGGHGGNARVVGIGSSGPNTFRARVLRVSTGGGPNQTPTGSVEFFRTNLPEATVTPLFERMRTALAAHVTTERRPPASPDQVALGSFGISSNNTSLELQLRDTSGGVSARAWQGYGGSIDANGRVPVELAWRALSEAAAETTAFPNPEPEDRALVRAAWRGVAGFERPWYATRALLIFAAKAGSPDLIHSLTKQLDSSDPEVQGLAVDALAAITGYDVRRDSSGNAREIGDLVADYRRECSEP